MKKFNVFYNEYGEYGTWDTIGELLGVSAEDGEDAIHQVKKFFSEEYGYNITNWVFYAEEWSE